MHTRKASLVDVIPCDSVIRKNFDRKLTWCDRRCRAPLHRLAVALVNYLAATQDGLALVTAHPIGNTIFCLLLFVYTFERCCKALSYKGIVPQEYRDQERVKARLYKRFVCNTSRFLLWVCNFEMLQCENVVYWKRRMSGAADTKEE